MGLDLGSSASGAVASRKARNCNMAVGSRRLARPNRASKSLVKHANRAELHFCREFIAAARAGALGTRAHGPKRPSSGILAEGNTLHGEARNRPARALANYCPVPQAIACFCILARQITFGNKIPTARVLRRPPVDNESFIQALLSGF